MIALPLLLLVAVASLWQLGADLREYHTDEEISATVHPVWYHVGPFARSGARVALACAALLALLWRRSPERSASALRAGWLCSLALFVLPAAIPHTWSFRPEAFALPEARKILLAAAPAFALGAYVDLAPLAPSLCVGLSRAGLRLLRHEAQSVRLGIALVFLASLLLATMLAAVLGLSMPLVKDPWILAGLATLLAHYALATVLAGGLLANPARATLRRALTISALTLQLGGTILVLFGLTRVELLGKHLVKWGDVDGFLAPVAVLVIVVEFAGRSLVTAVATSDLLAGANFGGRERS